MTNAFKQALRILFIWYPQLDPDKTSLYWKGAAINILLWKKDCLPVFMSYRSKIRGVSSFNSLGGSPLPWRASSMSISRQACPLIALKQFGQDNGGARGPVSTTCAAQVMHLKSPAVFVTVSLQDGGQQIAGLSCLDRNKWGRRQCESSSVPSGLITVSRGHFKHKSAGCACRFCGSIYLFLRCICEHFYFSIDSMCVCLLCI